MRGMMAAALAAIASVSAPAWALDDTPENRAKQADRYLAATPPKEMMHDLADKMALNIPLERRKHFKDLMTKHLDIEELERAIRSAMVKHFTADELKALADFYSSPVGKSAMKKFGAYMAEVMPALQAQLARALAKASQEPRHDDTEK